VLEAVGVRRPSPGNASVIGVDVVDVERLRSALQRSPGLEERLFNSAERAYCFSHPDPVVHFAGTLAAKEAVIKALRLGSLAAWARRVEITRDEGGVPSAAVASEAHSIAVSISHDGPVAVAVALAAEGPRNPSS
jgi:holo-[acyl-carrier protein] synthase